MIKIAYCSLARSFCDTPGLATPNAAIAVVATQRDRPAFHSVDTALIAVIHDLVRRSVSVHYEHSRCSLLGAACFCCSRPTPRGVAIARALAGHDTRNFSGPARGLFVHTGWI